MNTLTSIVIAFLVISIIMYVWLTFKWRKQVKNEQQLRAEAEASKQQIIVEQTRNRQLKQEMTNNIAHELKTPVSSIRGYLEILMGDKPVTDEQRKYFIERCYNQTLRLSDLINDVSLINKLEEAEDLFNREPVNLRAQAEEAILELQPKAEQHNITITDELPTDLIVNGNSQLLYSIFRNLIENALEYAGDNISVGIRCYGKGVSNEYLPKLFDRFLRIDEGRSRKRGGTGLGLSIVKHAVLFHGGDIYVKNRENGGLEFFFSLQRHTA